MGIQQRVKSFLSSAMDQLDGETITIGGTDVSAVIDATEVGDMLGSGAKATQRTLVVQYSIADYSAAVRSGESVTARGETWQVAAEDGGVRRGQAAVTLTLVEPERRPLDF
jgi:hypothetical protein